MHLWKTLVYKNAENSCNMQVKLSNENLIINFTTKLVSNVNFFHNVES